MNGWRTATLIAQHTPSGVRQHEGTESKKISPLTPILLRYEMLKCILSKSCFFVFFLITFVNIIFYIKIKLFVQILQFYFYQSSGEL